MNIDRLFLLFVAICAVFVSITAVLLPEKEGVSDGRITILSTPNENRLESAPKRVNLQTIVSTPKGIPVPNAKILINGQDSGASSDENGLFIINNIRPNDLISLEKEGYVSYGVQASSLSIRKGHDGITNLIAYPFNFSFTVTPSGGVFAGNEIKIDIPSGAVNENVTISAALLPTHIAYDPNEEVQIERIATVALEPSGTSFNMPITISLKKPLESIPTDNQLLLYDELSQRHDIVENTNVNNNNNILSFEVSHFSRYSIGNPSVGIQTVRIGLPSKDANGDKRINPIDATSAVLLSGGTHAANWSSSEQYTYKINLNTTRGSGSGSTRTNAITGEASTPYISVSASQNVSNATTRDILKKLGYSNSTSTISMSTETLSVEESGNPSKNTLACKIIFPLIEPWRVRLYKKIDPLNDLPLVERAFNGKNRKTNTFYNFKIEGSDAIVSGAPLAGGQRIAVRRAADGSLEVFRVTDEYILRKPVGSDLDNCSEHQGQGTNIASQIDDGIANGGAEDLQSFFGGETLASSTFTKDQTVYYAGQDKDGYASIQYNGWGILSSSTPIYRNDRECGSGDVTDSFTIINSTESVNSTNYSKSSSYTKTNSVSASVSASPLTGVSFGGSISASKSANTVNSYSIEFGRNSSFLRSVNYTTTIKAPTTPPHTEHLSDHVLYDLHVLYTVRQWMPLLDNMVPQELKDSTGTGSIPSVYFANAGEQQFMRRRNEGWFISGPVQHKSRKLGVAVIRVSEKSCIEDSSTSITETNETEEIVTIPVEDEEDPTPLPTDEPMRNEETNPSEPSDTE